MLHFSEVVLSIEASRNLLSLILKGNQDAYEKVIEYHIGVTLKIANYYARKYCKSNRDDVQSAAIEGLVVAVDRITNGVLTDYQMTPYICKTLTGFCRAFLEEDHLIRVPRDAFAELVKEKSPEEFMPQVFSLNKTNEVLDGDAENQVHVDDYLFPPSPALQLSYFDSLFTAMNISTMARAAIIYRYAGYTFTEIAELLDCSRRNVIYMFDEFPERINKEDI